MQCSYGNYYQHRYSHCPLSWNLRQSPALQERGFQQIATLHKQGLSVTDIIAEYTFLNLAQVYAALAYYANQTEIEALIEEEAKYDRLSGTDGWVEPMANPFLYWWRCDA